MFGGSAWFKASHKHPVYASVPCVFKRTVCLHGSILWDVCVSSLIHVCLWMTAWNGLPLSSPLAFHGDSWAWLWRGALVLSACSGGPQDSNTWWAFREPGSTHKMAHCRQATRCSNIDLQADYKPLKWQGDMFRFRVLLCVTAYDWSKYKFD